MCENPRQRSGDMCISARRYPSRGAWTRKARPPTWKAAVAEARRWPARRSAARGARHRPRRGRQVSNWHEPTRAAAHGMRRALASRTHHTKQELRRQRGEQRRVVVRLCRDAHLATLAPLPARTPRDRPLAALDGQRRTARGDLHAPVQARFDGARSKRRSSRAALARADSAHSTDTG